MHLDPNSQAILLLCAHFSRARKGEPNPLSPTEYGHLAAWLGETGHTPADLISGSAPVLATWPGPRGKVTRERLEYLLGRGAAMALALEKWSSAGLWILTRASKEYPVPLKRKVGLARPPVLIGAGNASLLERGGVAIVGSRSIGPDEESFAREVARAAAAEGQNVVSGGARGVDEIAMMSALEAGGTSLGVMANGLWAAALSGKWRPHLMRGDLCLVSSYHPEVGFIVGNAMGRNQYVYSLADCGVVVRCDEGKGGTWAGAKEALRKGLAPVFVKAPSSCEGCTALIELGARPLALPPAEQGGAGEDGWLVKVLHQEPAVPDDPEAPAGAESAPQPCSDFEPFLEDLIRFVGEEGKVTLSMLRERHVGVPQARLIEWLKRAVEAGSVARPTRLHRYEPPAPGLFGVPVKGS